MKIGDLIIRDSDGRYAMIVDTRRSSHGGIISVQYYAVDKETGYTGWHCDVLAKNWRLL